MSIELTFYYNSFVTVEDEVSVGAPLVILTDTADEKINVKDIVRLWTWAQSIDLVEFGKWRYNMMSADDIWVPGNNVRDFDESEMLNHLSKNPFAERIVEILYKAHQLFGGDKISRLSQS